LILTTKTTATTITTTALLLLLLLLLLSDSLSGMPSLQEDHHGDGTSTVSASASASATTATPSYWTMELNLTQRALSKLESKHQQLLLLRQRQQHQQLLLLRQRQQQQQQRRRRVQKNNDDDDDDDADEKWDSDFDKNNNDSDNNDEDEDEDDNENGIMGATYSSSSSTAATATVLNRLLQLQHTTDSLVIIQDWIDFLKHTTQQLVVRMDHNNSDMAVVGTTTTTTATATTTDMILVQSQICQSLAERVLLKDHPHQDPNDDDDDDVAGRNDNINRNAMATILDVCPFLYDELYLPFYEYVQDYLVILLRKTLHSVRYPQPRGCATLLGLESSWKNSQPQPKAFSNSTFLRICSSLRQLERIHQQVLGVVQQQQQQTSTTTTTTTMDAVLLELFHPLLDRVHFHFINPTAGVGTSSSSSSTSTSTTQPKVTATRIDRLPEWLLTYIRDNFLQTQLQPHHQQQYQQGRDRPLSLCTPYDVIMAIDPPLVVPFFQEIINLIRWTILDQRQFFQHPSIMGKQSNPQLLLNAIQQFIQFDCTMHELLLLARTVSTATTTPTTMDNNRRRQQQREQQQSPHYYNNDNTKIAGLMDVLVASNDELMNWWMERERESVFGTLFPEDDNDDDDDDDDDNNDNHNNNDHPQSSATTNTPPYSSPSLSLTNHVSKRAELFCSLIRSIQYKADTFVSSAKYIRHVAVPLCSQFLDAVHDTSRVLLRQLVTPPSVVMMNTTKRGTRTTTSSSVSSSPSRPSNNHLVSGNVIHSWIELVNGTHLAAKVLLTKERTRTTHQPQLSASSPSKVVGSGGNNNNNNNRRSGGGTYPVSSDHDLARLGRSMERLAEAMVDDFVSAYVEVVLMEKARLASYLMMSSHLLASHGWDSGDDNSNSIMDYDTTTTTATTNDGRTPQMTMDVNDEDELSVELRDTKIVLHDFFRVCNSIIMIPNGNGRGDGGGTQEQLQQLQGSDDDGYHHGIASFAPLSLRQHIMNSVATKLLEVALDWNHVTPEIWYTGAKIFARDVRNVLGLASLSSSSSSSSKNSPWQLEIESVHRLVEVTKLMTMPYKGLEGLRAALNGLVGTSTTDMDGGDDDNDYYFLVLDDFMADSTIHEEAVCMLKAKHLDCPLEDAISILNRRRT
jgi:hypothetical protein